MLKRVLLLLIFLSAANYVIAGGVHGIAPGASAGLVALLQPHHHHEDGSVVTDESAESLGHLLLDHATPMLALCMSTPWDLGSSTAVLSLALVHAPSDPFLPSLRRPPRSA